MQNIISSYAQAPEMGLFIFLLIFHFLFLSFFSSSLLFRFAQIDPIIFHSSFRSRNYLFILFIQFFDPPVSSFSFHSLFPFRNLFFSLFRHISFDTFIRNTKGVRMFTTGYGIKTKKIEWKDNIYTHLFKLVIDDPEIGKPARKFFEENRHKYISDEECLKEFVQFYYKNGWNDVEDFLTDYINNKYCESKKIFKCKSKRIFVEAYVPINENDKMPSQKEIKDILSECLKPLIKSPVSVGWCRFFSFA